MTGRRMLPSSPGLTTRRRLRGRRRNPPSPPTPDPPAEKATPPVHRRPAARIANRRAANGALESAPWSEKKAAARVVDQLRAWGYERLQPGCPPRGSFRVITNPGVYSGDHRINPQGVITAYKPREGSSAAAD